MDQETKDRLSRCFDAFMARLPKRYYWGNSEPGGGGRLVITERAPAGQTWANGEKYRTVGGVSPRELAVIAAVTTTDEELIEKIDQHMIQGIDVVKAAKTPALRQDLDAIVDKRVEERLAAEMQKILLKMQDLQEKKSKDEPAPFSKLPKPRSRKRKSRQDPDASLAVWTARAAESGLSTPSVHPSDPKLVDGRWLRVNRPIYEAWQESQQPAASQPAS